MHLYFDNVNDAFYGMMRGFETGGFESAYHNGLGNRHYFVNPPIAKEPTRAGVCHTIQEPVMLTYANPRRRVLFGAGRDANPFFHMVEALWMLAGRNDIKHLEYYNARVKEFSDDGETWYDAYGYRWRHPYGLLRAPIFPENAQDQLERVIRLLRTNPSNRRVVLSMWQPSDLQRVEEQPNCKAVPCNLEVMFRVRLEPRQRGQTYTVRQDSLLTSDMQLDITVTNRSNDTIWGVLGSNYVTFSMLQEYVACSLGIQVGKYHQISNNMHVYAESGTSNQFDPRRLLLDPMRTPVGDLTLFVPSTKAMFDADLKRLFDRVPLDHHNTELQTPYLYSTVWLMLNAWYKHKRRDYDTALYYANKILAPDWRAACVEWLQRRQAKHTQKETASATQTSNELPQL